MAKCGWVLCTLCIVERDPAQAVGKRASICRVPGFVKGGSAKRAGLAIERQRKDNLAKSVIVEIFSNDQGLWEAYQHAFETFWFRKAGKWHGHIDRCHTAAATVDNICHRRGVAVRAINCRLIEALTGVTGHTHNISDIDEIGRA